MPFDREKAEEYIQEFVQTLKTAPQGLSKTEKRLGSRYMAAQENVAKVNQDLEQLRSQIQQGEARFRSLELQRQAEVGKAEGFLSALVALEFDDDAEVDKHLTSITKPKPKPSSPKAKTSTKKRT